MEQEGCHPSKTPHLLHFAGLAAPSLKIEFWAVWHGG